MDGIGGIFRASCSILCCRRSVCDFLGGNLGGSDGNDGLLESVEATVVVVLVLDGALLTYFGRSVEYLRGALAAPLGGSAGSSQSPQAGALIRSLDSLLTALELLVLLPFV